MDDPRWSTLPNAITVGRIVLAPVIFALIFVDGFWARLLAFVLFLVAAISDLWDGYLARKHGWISDFGKLWDPLADKLLLVATVTPFYILSHGDGPVGALPFIGELPLWIVLVIFGRELLITVLRGLAARRGVVIPAAQAGKYKAVLQNVFSGATIFWYALQTAAYKLGWAGFGWDAWQVFHGAVLITALALAVLFTVYSMIVYLWAWRKLLTEAI